MVAVNTFHSGVRSRLSVCGVAGMTGDDWFPDPYEALFAVACLTILAIIFS